MEMILFTGMPDLNATLERTFGMAVSVLSVSRTENALRQLDDDRRPGAIYLDDRPRSGGVRIGAADYERIIRAAQERNVTVLVNFTGAALGLLTDLQRLGIPTTSRDDAGAVAQWIGEVLKLRAEQRSAALPAVAIGAAKGGVGKTTVAIGLAEALRRRGLRILILDGDISNPGLAGELKVPQSAPSYLNLVRQGIGSLTPSALRDFIYHPEQTRADPQRKWGQIDMLVGTVEKATAENDIRMSEWEVFYDLATRMEGYDLVVVDTPPDYVRRPYPTYTLFTGGYVVLPCPVGFKERRGVFQMLSSFADEVPDAMSRAMLFYKQPPKDVASVVDVHHVAKRMAASFPDTTVLGIVPHAGRLLAVASEYSEGYLSPLDLDPPHPYVQALYGAANTLAGNLGLTLPTPPPSLGVWERLKAQLRGDRVTTTAAGTTSRTFARAD